MRDSQRPATVVFLLAGSEEYGAEDGFGRGAVAYYRSPERDLRSCIGHIDVDTVGNALSCPQLFVSGPKPFRDALLDERLSSKYRIRGRSGWGGDHGAAEAAGIPCAWFTDIVEGSFPQLHTPQDRIEYLDFEAMADIVNDVEGAVDRLSHLRPVFPVIRHDGFRVRPARSADIPRILDITRDAFRDFSMAYLQQQFFGQKLGGNEWWEYKLRDIEKFCRSEMLHAIVAEADGKVVGYATYTVDSEREIGAIGNNAVDPGYQRRGIGTALQSEIDRRMREEGLTSFQVSTLGHDIHAQRIYERLGYSRLAEMYHYVRKG
jgi:ribosomal protein S18 acetylase RimI-like enzyme